MKSMSTAEERFRIVADFTYDWEYWIDPYGQLVYMSPSCERISGYSINAFLQDPALIERIVHPDDRQTWSDHRNLEQESDSVLDIDFRILTRNGEERWISHYCQPAYDIEKECLGRRVSNRDITERKQVEKEREDLITKLKEAMAKIKTLTGLLPICASCKRIRDNSGSWQQIEKYISDRSHVDFSHSLCPECAARLYPRFFQDR